MSVSQPPASEQAMNAKKYPNTYRHPTADEIKAEASAWKNLSVTAIAAENSSVAEYIAQIEKDAERFRWLLEDHEHPSTRELRNSLLSRMQVMSYSAACTSIDAAIAARKGEQ